MSRPASTRWQLLWQGIAIWAGILLSGCRPLGTPPGSPDAYGSFPVPKTVDIQDNNDKLPYTYHHIRRAIAIREYFEYMDTLVAHFDSLLPYPINEHIIVRANPWLIDTLAATDYYQLMEMGKFIYDPNAIVVLRRGDSLAIPKAEQVEILLDRMANTVIDVNIPEFKLRIIEQDSTLFTMLVRVGRNETKYLAMAGKEVDLRTHPGTGKVVRINKDPIFINPSDNHRYTVTRRDDRRVTKLPRIPWIEMELDGRRYGQLIHPTTNLETLGKAYSNGCIGTRESDAWRIYYFAPLDTKVVVRYDLQIEDENGETILLKDIYPQRFKVAGVWKSADLPSGSSYCDCR